MSSIASYIILLYISICFVQPQSTDFSTATIVTDRIPSEPNTDASDSPKPTDANSPSAPFVSAGTSNVGDSSPIPNQGTGASSAVALSTHSGSMLSDASASGQTNPSSTSSTTSTTSTSTTASTTTFATGITKIFRSFSKICASCSGHNQCYVRIRCARYFSPRSDHQR